MCSWKHWTMIHLDNLLCHLSTPFEVLSKCQDQVKAVINCGIHVEACSRMRCGCQYCHVSFFNVSSELFQSWWFVWNFVTTTENVERKVTIKVLGSGMVVNVSDCSLLCYRDYLQIVEAPQNTNINVTTTNQKLFITIKCINRYHSCLSNMKWTLFFSKSSINLCHYPRSTIHQRLLGKMFDLTACDDRK